MQLLWGETDESTVIVTVLTQFSWNEVGKKSQDIKALNNAINKHKLLVTYRTLSNTEYTFLCIHKNIYKI